LDGDPSVGLQWEPTPTNKETVLNDLHSFILGRESALVIKARFGLDGPWFVPESGRHFPHKYTPNLLYNGYRVLSRDKAAGACGGIIHPNLAPGLKKEYSCNSATLLGLACMACCRVTFTFLPLCGNGCTIGQKAQSPVCSFHFHTSCLVKVIGLLFRERCLFIVTFMKLEARSRAYGLKGA